MKRVEQLLIFVFGANRKVRYMRMLLFIAITALCVIAIQNISCGYDKNGFWFKWEPAIDEIKVTK